MKKIILKVLLGVLALSVMLTGCIQNNDSKNVGTKNTESNPQVIAQTKPVKIMYSEPRESNQQFVDKVKNYIEEKSGVKFEIKNIKTAADFQGAVNMSIASNEDIDVILASNDAHFRSLLERNVFQKINDPIEKYGKNLLKQFNKDAWKSVTDKNGNILGIPREGDTLSDLICIRKDWREKLGMGPITTLDEFEEYLRAVKDSDFDGNGIKDAIPFTTTKPYDATNTKVYDGLDLALLYCFTETNPSGNYIDSNGKVTPVEMHPKYKDYLSTLAKWTKDGLLHSDITIIKKTQVNDLISNNRVGALAGWYSDYIRPTELLVQKVEDAEYEYITPKTINGNDYKLTIMTHYQGRAGILSYSKNAEFAVKFFDWMMASKDNYLTTKKGIPGEDFAWANQEKTATENLTGIVDGVVKPEAGYNYQFSMLFYAPWDPRSVNPGFVDSKYFEGQDWHHKYNSFISPPDWFVMYIWKGTPIENSQQDALTMIQEAKAKIILGEKSIDEWDSVIAQYKNIFGDKYIELATQQFNDYK